VALRDDLEVTPLHRSLLSPVLVFGVERQLVGPLLALAAMLLFAFRLNPVTPTLAVLLLAVGLPALRRLARHDPWTFRVLLGHLRTAGFYPPLARHDVPRRQVPTF
jgi:type IV secretory pathway TrbD component